MRRFGIFKEFNIVALPRKAWELLHQGSCTLLLDQYLFEKTATVGQEAASALSKFQLVRGRMVDNMYRKLSRGDLDSRPIAYAAMNLAERYGPFVMKTMSKTATNPIAASAFIVAAGLLLDETTRSMITEQISNMTSLFSTQAHDVEDQIHMHEEMHHSTKRDIGQP